MRLRGSTRPPVLGARQEDRRPVRKVAEAGLGLGMDGDPAVTGSRLNRENTGAGPAQPPPDRQQVVPFPVVRASRRDYGAGATLGTALAAVPVIPAIHRRGSGLHPL